MDNKDSLIYLTLPFIFYYLHLSFSCGVYCCFTIECTYAGARPRRSSDKLLEILGPLTKELQTKRHNFPLTLIYRNLETISESYFSQTLGIDQYDPPGAAALAKNRMFTQFHAQYPEHERKRIVSELAKGESRLRVLFVTVSFGIEIDIKKDTACNTHWCQWRSTFKRLDDVDEMTYHQQR